MQITAAERGRRLVLTIGGPTPDMTDEEAQEAAEDVLRVSVPPLSARLGTRLFAFYAGIAFARQESLDAVGFEGSPEEAVAHMTRMALGALEISDVDGGSEADRIIARERWDKIQTLRWDEAQTVCNAALFWNVQGGSMEAVQALLDESTNDDGTPAGGVPKAQELVLAANGLNSAFSRLKTLLDSELNIGTSTADTPSTSDANSPTDSSEQPDTSEKSTEPSASEATRKTTTRSRSSSASGQRAKSTRTSSGASRSSSGTASRRSTSTSGSSGTTRTRTSGTADPGATSTPASSD
jgi:hypothetical protein